MEQNIKTKDVQRTEYLDKNGLDMLWAKVKENTNNQVEVERNRATASENSIANDLNGKLGNKANTADVDTKFTEEKNRVDGELGKKFDKESVAQESGDAEDKVMSQKATSTAIADETTRAKAAEEAILFDVSYNNNGAVFESISALLGDANLSTLIPTSVRHGGMSIRFIQSSDNKYVQYRLMSTDWSITENDWQGVDDEPTAGSDNLVKSGGVYNSTPTVANSSTESDLDISDEYGNVLVRFASGHIKVKNFDSADINESISAILSNIGFDNITEFSEEEDYDIGEIVRYGKLVYVFTSAHKAGEWDVSEVKETVITTEHPIEVSDEVSEADLDISDEHGNVIMRLKDGHIQTQKFNSLTPAGGRKITYSIIKNL